MREESKQKVIGCMIAAGAVICVAAIFFIYLFSVAGVYRGTYTREPVTNRITDAGTMNLVPLMILLLVVGILLIFGAVGYGLWTVKHENTGPRQVIEHFRILARYAYDKNHNYLMDDAQIEHAEGVRFYVRGHVPNGEMLEYQTSAEMWRQCGEGMYGEVELEGKWIGRFTPYIGAPQEVA